MLSKETQTHLKLYSKIVQDSTWFDESNSRANTIESAWLPWLLDRGSLTSALVNYSAGEFEVRVLSEFWRKPLVREAGKLGLEPHLAARVREVELLCKDEVMVYARSIIPLYLYQQEPATFQGMGSKPLGHLLFQDGRPRFRQRNLSVYQRTGQATIFGRATPYQYHGGEILVSEFFLNSELKKAVPS